MACLVPARTFCPIIRAGLGYPSPVWYSMGVKHMFLAVHASVGALVGSSVSNPATAFTLGFLLHFAFDMIPHGDQVVYESFKRGDGLRKAIVHTLLDAIATAITVTAIFLSGNLVSDINVVAGIIGGLLPDLLVGLQELTRPRGIRWSGRQLTKFSDWHMKNHMFLIRRLFRADIPLRYGYLLQAIAIVAILKIIF